MFRYSFLLAMCLVPNALFAFKFVGLVPVRNEEIMIEHCLRALACYTDAIVVLDDCSTDNTCAIVEALAQECNVVKIIHKTAWHRDEPGDKNMLLQAGRDAGGTHFIVIDADEMLTANFMHNNQLRATVQQMSPGDTLALCWIQLWRSVNHYRFDNSVWTWNYKTIIFADNKTAAYSSGFIHTAPVPNGLRGKKRQLDGYEYGLLHFQFVNWHNLLVKQAWYRCLERMRYPNKTDQAINRTYAASKDERSLKLQPVPQAWFAAYPFFDPELFNTTETWRKEQVRAWFSEYGTEFFKKLDIWDVDWKSEQ